MQQITPFLWFNTEAEEAAKYYVSIFKNSKITAVTHYGETGKENHGKPVGSVMTVEFELNGQQFTAINGGSMYKINGGISFVVNCETQEEVDHFWSKLSAGGQEIQCGWLTDKFGVTWQVTPTIMIKYLKGPDPVKTQRAFAAMMQMVKLDIQKLKDAYEGR